LLESRGFQIQKQGVNEEKSGHVIGGKDEPGDDVVGLLSRYRQSLDIFL